MKNYTTLINRALIILFTLTLSNLFSQSFPFKEDFEAEWIMKITDESLTDSIVRYSNKYTPITGRNLDYLSGDTLFTINNIDYWGIRGYVRKSIHVGTGEVYWQHLTYEPIKTNQWEMATRPTFTVDNIYIPLIVEIPDKGPFLSGSSWEEGNVGLLTLDRKTGAVIDKFISDYYHDGNLLLTPPYDWKYYDNLATDLFYFDGVFGYYSFDNENTFYPDFYGWDTHNFYRLNLDGEVIDSSFEKISKYSGIRSKVLTYTDNLTMTSSSKYEILDTNAIVIENKFIIDKYDKHMRITDSINLSDIGQERIDFHGYSDEGDLLFNNFDSTYNGTTFYIMDWDKNIKWQAQLDSVGGLKACFYNDRIAVAAFNKELESKEVGIYITDGEGVFKKRLNLVRNKENQSVFVYQLKATDDGGLLLNFDCSDDKLDPLGWTRDNYWIKFSKEQLLGPSSTEKLSRNDITLFPNPSHDFIQLNSLKNIDKLHILSSDGSLVKSVPVQEKIDITDLPAGTYYLKQDFKWGSLSKRFLKL